ncbi:hypothetical protein DY000_02029972 [Brassica cretica]|uniref:Uncharacterized protein n=1 Tax=Brassica cretica TaxID=69181 RepID=A0ABQ7DLV3_BRACR|nr:hypothetical protein DY000_02029972 [Brassica cretica]
MTLQGGKGGSAEISQKIVELWEEHPQSNSKAVDEKSARRPKYHSSRNMTLQGGKGGSAEISQKIVELWEEHPQSNSK